VRAYEVAVRGVARLPRRASDAAKLQFIEDMKRLRELRDRVVELRRGSRPSPFFGPVMRRVLDLD
jgi:hypothetical protein